MQTMLKSIFLSRAGRDKKDQSQAKTKRVIIPRWCKNCGRPKHKGLCNLVELSDGRLVHESRVEDYESEVHDDILMGKVKVKNRWVKKNDKKLA